MLARGHTRRLLLEIIDTLKDIDSKMEEFIKTTRARKSGLDVDPLLRLPGHLQQTYIALAKLGDAATAEEVSQITGRVRAVESSHLNLLVTMRYASKERKGRKVFFSERRVFP